MWCKRLACACQVAVQPGGIETLIAKEGGGRANHKKRPDLSAGTRRDVIQRHSEKRRQDK